MLGELISAGANILGGILGSNAADKQAEANRQMQLDFMQHGLNYKAADARDAEKRWGINPLALLGVNTNAFQNVVGGDGGAAGMALLLFRQNSKVIAANTAATIQLSEAVVNLEKSLNKE